MTDTPTTETRARQKYEDIAETHDTYLVLDQTESTRIIEVVQGSAAAVAKAEERSQGLRAARPVYVFRLESVVRLEPTVVSMQDIASKSSSGRMVGDFDAEFGRRDAEMPKPPDVETYNL